MGIDDNPVNVQKAILHHDEGVDLLPSNIELSGLEVRLINAISRESVLKTCINEEKKNYDVVLVDCMPSLPQGIFLCDGDCGGNKTEHQRHVRF